MSSVSDFHSSVGVEMLRGKESVSALLVVISESGVPLSSIASLSYYQKLKKKYAYVNPSNDDRDVSKENTLAESERNKCCPEINLPGVGLKRGNKEGKDPLETPESTKFIPLINFVRRLFMPWSSPASNEICAVRRRCSSSSAAWSVFQYIAVMFLGVLLYIVHQEQLWTHRGFSRFWMTWENIALEAEVVSYSTDETIRGIRSYFICYETIRGIRSYFICYETIRVMYSYCILRNRRSEVEQNNPETEKTKVSWFIIY